MSDFMKWLYVHYIKPQIDAAEPGGYEKYGMYLDLARNGLAPHENQALEKTVEYVALQAFQLGFRTGRGLSE